MNHIIRHKYKTATLGILVVGDHQFEVTELKWDDNKVGVSCIPDGIYPYRRDKSVNKDRVVIEILNVPGRSQIQIHAIGKLEGCVGLHADGKGETALEVEALVTKLMGDCGYINIASV